MVINWRFFSILAVVLWCSSSAYATVITFEEVGAISAVRVFPRTLGIIDIGSMGVFNTVAANLARMSASSPNAGFLERAVSYPIRMSDGGRFDFVSADVSRSNSDSSLFRFEGIRDGLVTFFAEMPGQLFPFTFAANWAGLDSVRIFWTGADAFGIAALDNFTFEVRTVPPPDAAVPAPGTAALVLIGLLGAAKARRCVKTRSASCPMPTIISA